MSLSTANKIELKNIAIGYRDNILFSNIDVNAKENEMVCLAGANGIGKSTLLRCIAGLQKPLHGDILINNENTKNVSLQTLSHQLSYVSTEMVHTGNLSVFELVALGRYPYTNWIGRLTTDDIQLVYHNLEITGLLSKKDKNINEISDGERQKAMVARALAQDTSIIILDEPTAFLDISNKYEIINLLHQIVRKNNKIIIFTSHDLNIALQESDKIWLMPKQGNIIQGAPEDLILNNNIQQLFEKSTIYFDINDGSYKIPRITSKEIGLSGDGLYYNWTKKALERYGYKIIDFTNKTKINIQIKDKKWIVIPDNKEFFSIYELINFLSLLK